MGEKMGTPEGVQRDPNGVTKSGGNTPEKHPDSPPRATQRQASQRD